MDWVDCWYAHSRGVMLPATGEIEVEILPPLRRNMTIEGNSQNPLNSNSTLGIETGFQDGTKELGLPPDRQCDPHSAKWGSCDARNYFNVCRAFPTGCFDLTRTRTISEATRRGGERKNVMELSAARSPVTNNRRYTTRECLLVPKVYSTAVVPSGTPGGGLPGPTLNENTIYHLKHLVNSGICKGSSNCQVMIPFYDHVRLVVLPMTLLSQPQFRYSPSSPAKAHSSPPLPPPLLHPNITFVPKTY